MKSRIIVDTGRASTLNSGLGQVVYLFAEAVDQNPPDDMEFTFLLHKDMLPVFRSSFNFDTTVPGPLRRMLPGAFSGGDIWHVLNPDSRSVPLSHPGLIVTLHDLRVLTVKHGNRATAYKKQLQRLVSNAAGLTAISQFTRAGMQDNFDIPAIPFEVIRNGISVPDLSSIDTGTEKAAPYLFALGLFEEKKRFHLLVEMMQHLPEFNLCLAGVSDNSYGNMVKQQAHELGLDNRVHFTGAVDEQRKWQLYANSEALVFPSELEGFGLPVLEAMALGKPVFISKDGALPETGGSLANYFNSLVPEEMAGTIRSSMNTNQQSAAQDREDYARSFSWKTAVEQYLSFYRAILD